MASRPLVQVYNGNGEVVDQVRLPSVFLTSIRDDIVQFVHTNLNKNKRQPYGVAKWAGHQSSAESWGTGRAVARIPRVPGGGTHRAGQGAFGNMCRGGRMFSPLRVWRRWHRKVHTGTKRYAVASALAASAVPALVMARGHKISSINEIPLVIANESMEGLHKTKKAAAVLKALKANEDSERVKNTIVTRAGKGKLRNRPYKERVGPLIVYGGSGDNIAPAFRAIPGVELVNVHNLNLLRLAPGGHVGRFVIWTRGAFEQLDSIFGTFKQTSQTKKDFRLPRSIISNPDVERVINSDAIRAAFRPVKLQTKFKKSVNPLRHAKRMASLNPYAKIAAQLSQQKAKAAVAAKAAKAPKQGTPGKPNSSVKYQNRQRVAKFVSLVRQ